MRLGALFLCAASAFGADMSGMWIGQIPARNQMLDIAFQFTQTGETLSGKLYGDYESTASTEGRISGDNVSFVRHCQGTGRESDQRNAASLHRNAQGWSPRIDA